MGKQVGMAEFKANCTRLMRELSRNGEAITVTVRGKPVAVVSAPPPKASESRLAPVFGMLASDKYRFDADPEETVFDMEEWEANNTPELYRRS